MQRQVPTAFMFPTNAVEVLHIAFAQSRAVRTWTLDIISTSSCTWQALALVFSRQSTIASGRISLNVYVTIASEPFALGN